MKRIFRPLIPFSSVGFFKEIVGRYPKPKELYEFQQYIKQLEKQGLLDRNRWAQTFRPAWEVKAVHKYFKYLKENIYKSSKNVLTRIRKVVNMIRRKGILVFVIVMIFSMLWGLFLYNVTEYIRGFIGELNIYNIVIYLLIGTIFGLVMYAFVKLIDRYS